MSDIPSEEKTVIVPHATVIPTGVPVSSRPTPFWRRWGPVEWIAVAGFACTTLGWAWNLSMTLHDHSRDISQIKSDQGDMKDVQKDQGRDTKKILWFLAEDYKHKDESRGPSTRPFLARTEPMTDEMP